MENISISKETFIERLEAFMKAEGLNPNSLTIAAGLSNGLVGKALKRRSSMNSDSIERILCTYTDLSADWLLTGRGTMYVKQLSVENESSSTQGDHSLVLYLREKVNELENETRELLKENASLKIKLELQDNSNFKAG